MAEHGVGNFAMLLLLVHAEMLERMVHTESIIAAVAHHLRDDPPVCINCQRARAFTVGPHCRKGGVNVSVH